MNSPLVFKIPHAVHIALPAFHSAPALDFPPLEIYRVSEPAYSAGVEEHSLDGVTVPIYGRKRVWPTWHGATTRPTRNMDFLALDTFLGSHQPDVGGDRPDPVAGFCRSQPE